MRTHYWALILFFSLGIVEVCGCGGTDQSGSDSGDSFDAHSTVTYLPHTVLNLQTAIDQDGNPDIADPVVIRDEDTWYLYATQTKKDLHVWRSKDLKDWVRSGPVWEPTPGAWNARGQVWAPHVQATDEGYYMYYTADMQIGVARADTPKGPFIDVFDHPLVGGGYGGVGDGKYQYDPGDGEYDFRAAFALDFEEKAIDAFVLKASDGSLTLYFSAYRPFSMIYGVPMTSWTSVADEAPTTLIEPDPQGWEGFVAEGAWVVEHDGRFHLMYSGNAADMPQYSIGAAVGDSPLGPFVKYAENPILSQDPDADFFGPGHHCLVEGAFGDLLMFYHTKVSKQQGFDRRIRYAPVAFDGDDGHIKASPP
ncbi:MAG: family 43 glycosylhydrolase [Deltaproteobacteria bacterium]|nr:family 43 glycosylhydrolase [Deltaproteobacteria bacterium]